MKILRNLMIFILLIAGVTHFIYPGLFLMAMPPYIPFHLELVYFTGVLELIFAVGLMTQRFQSISAKLLALYFIAILPAHVHVAMNGIKIFGISSPIALWGRTAFQAVFIFWAWKLR